MVAQAHERGNKISHDNKENKWKFIGNDRYLKNQDVKSLNKIKCPKCEQYMKYNEPDKCIGLLPGVKNACCGHGEHEGYISFTNGVVIRFTNLRVEKG